MAEPPSNPGVGPVLRATGVGRRLAELLVETNEGAASIDRGSYLRVHAPGRCVLLASDLALAGSELGLRAELERTMLSFAGRLELDDRQAVFVDGSVRGEG